MKKNKKGLIDPKTIKLKRNYELNVMDKFKMKSIRSANQLKVGDVVYGFFFGGGVIKELILSKGSLFGASHSAWMVVDSIDGEWKNYLDSLADKNICNGGYNPWLLFKNEKDYIAYNNWCNQPVGKGVISHMEWEWDYDGDHQVPVFKEFSLKCERKTVQELAALGFKYKDTSDYR